MKECSEQAAKFLHAGKWDEVKPSASIQLRGSENHYSPKYVKCYIELVIADKEPSEANPGLYHELVDAFEGKIVATCSSVSTTDWQTGFYCEVTGSPFIKGADRCAVCNDFIKDHMEH